MNLIDYTNVWVKGEVLQGRIMIFSGVILLVAYILIWRSDNLILRGMLIPMSLMLIILIGFGTYQQFARPAHKKTLTVKYHENPRLTQDNEKARVYKDKNAYLKYKITWAILTVAGLILYFTVNVAYWKGLAMGIMLFAVSTLIVDTFLQQRSADYYDAIIKLEKENI